MSIQNSTRQDLNLENFKKLPKSINSFIVTPLIYFRLDQVYRILGLHLAMYLNILQSYHPRLAN